MHDQRGSHACSDANEPAKAYDGVTALSENEPTHGETSQATNVLLFRAKNDRPALGRFAGISASFMLIRGSEHGKKSSNSGTVAANNRPPGQSGCRLSPGHLTWMSVKLGTNVIIRRPPVRKINKRRGKKPTTGPAGGTF
jgi:hypothetical protein